MNSESKVLEAIWENNGIACVNLISFQTGFGAEYAAYICNYLLKKGKIRAVKGKRNCYKITIQGIRELKSQINSKASKKLKNKKNKYGGRRINFVEAQEKKLNLGRVISKAVFLLKRSKNKEEKQEIC